MHIRLLLPLLLLVQCKTLRPQESLDLSRASEVQAFVQRAPLCAQLRLAHRYAPEIAEGRGHGNLLLQAISKATGCSFASSPPPVPVMMGREDETTRLRTQLEALLTEQGCSSR